MRLVLFDDAGKPVVEIDEVQRFDLLALAAHLRLAITATSEGWELPPPPDPGEPGHPIATASEQPAESPE